VSERAKKGLFLSFQNPVEVPGISLENFVRSALAQKSGKPIRVWSFRKEVKAALETLDMDPSYAERDLNVGFSGGEKKKAEILQLLLLKPSLAILDETDSGLDVDAVRTVSKGIEAFQADKSASLLIITHNAAILSALKVDAVHILAGGKIVAEGGPELVDKITKEGFAAYEGEA
jgi:Fe-S cluster assembly ATP-binding protein